MIYQRTEKTICIVDPPRTFDARALYTDIDLVFLVEVQLCFLVKVNNNLDIQFSLDINLTK